MCYCDGSPQVSSHVMMELVSNIWRVGECPCLQSGRVSLSPAAMLLVTQQHFRFAWKYMLFGGYLDDTPIFKSVDPFQTTYTRRSQKHYTPAQSSRSWYLKKTLSHTFDLKASNRTCCCYDIQARWKRMKWSKTRKATEICFYCQVHIHEAISNVSL
jgi:hypothetical protein